MRLSRKRRSAWSNAAVSILEDSQLQSGLAEDSTPSVRKVRRTKRVPCLCKRCNGCDVPRSTRHGHKSRDTNRLKLLLLKKIPFQDECFDDFKYLQSYEDTIREHFHQVESSADAHVGIHDIGKSVQGMIESVLLEGDDKLPEVPDYEPNTVVQTADTPAQILERPVCAANRQSSPTLETSSEAPSCDHHEFQTAAQTHPTSPEETPHTSSFVQAEEDVPTASRLPYCGQHNETEAERLPYCGQHNETQAAATRERETPSGETASSRTCGMSLVDMQQKAMLLLGITEVESMYELFCKSMVTLRCYDATPNAVLRELVEWVIAAENLRGNN